MSLPGTTKVSRIQEKIDAAQLRFSQEKSKSMSDVLAQIEIVSDWYRESEKKRNGGEKTKKWRKRINK